MECAKKPQEQAIFEGEYRSLFSPHSSGQVLYNQRVKLYPDQDTGLYFIGQMLTYDRPHFNPQKWELRRDDSGHSEPIYEKPEPDDAADNSVGSWKRSYNRARGNCFDLIMCNSDLDTFCTFTVDASVCDRSNYDEIVRKLNVWLSNRVQRKGLKYILIPEYHADGKNIHFHGLTNFDGLKLVNSGHKRHGVTVYNVSDLPLGFSTAIRIKGENSIQRVSKYIWKYMTKQGGQKIGGRFFLHGGELDTPRYVYRNVSFMQADGVQITPYDGCACKVVSLTVEKKFFADSMGELYEITKFRNSFFTDLGK